MRSSERSRVSGRSRGKGGSHRDRGDIGVRMKGGGAGTIVPPPPAAFARTRDIGAVNIILRTISKYSRQVCVD